MNDRAARLTALTIASLSSFITPFMISSINIALPVIGKEFKTDAVVLSWVATSYLLAAAVSLVPFGKLADIYGRKKIYMIGIIIFTLTSFFSAVSVSAPMLIVIRIFQGAGSAMIYATGIAILSSVYPVQDRGRVFGIAVGATYIGLSCGPFFGGFLTQHLGWRSIFLVNIPFGVLIILLIAFKLKSGEWKGAEGQKFDLTGSIIYGTAIFAFMFGISILPEAMSVILMLTGAAGLAAFVKWELVVASPVFEVSLFVTNRTYAFSCLAALINYSATFAVGFLLSFYLQDIKGLSPELTGVVLVSTPIMMAVFSPFAGRLSDRVEPRVIATMGMGLTTLGLVPLIVLNNRTALAYIIVSLMILGFGFALFSSPNMNASMGIVTLIFSLFIGRAQITPQYYPQLIKSVRVAFIVFSAFCAGGIFFSLYRGRIRPTD